MKKSLLVPIALLLSMKIFSQSNPIAIIPEPVKLLKNSGYFVLPKNVSVEIPSGPDLKEIANSLKSRIAQTTGSTLTLSAQNVAAQIRFIINKTMDNSLGNEGYTLSASPKAIVIKANQPAGLFYGLQTLYQLFPNEIEGKSVAKNVKWQVPCVEITDYPRFGWRGLMLDVSRHFFTKQQVKDFIDEMVKYKYNMFHWHLTDDEGWRVEINSLHRLTAVCWNAKEIGIWRFSLLIQRNSNQEALYAG
jgi:hexosaminidase